MNTRGLLTNLLLMGILIILAFSAFNFYTFLKNEKLKDTKMEIPITKNLKDIVLINSYANYPLPTGKILNPTQGQGKEISYILPNGTKGEIVKWNEKYTTLSNPFAQIDMFAESEVKVLTGPMKGQTLLINHIYLTLID